MDATRLEKIADGYIKHYHESFGDVRRRRKRKHKGVSGYYDWAFEEMLELRDKEPEICWEIIHLIRRRDISDELLAYLAAGPVEDLLGQHGSRFIDRVELLARQDPQFKKILGAVWQGSMSDDIWKRVQAVAGPTW